MSDAVAYVLVVSILAELRTKLLQLGVLGAAADERAEGGREVSDAPWASPFFVDAGIGRPP